jgi:hypothetical protein
LKSVEGNGKETNADRRRFMASERTRLGVGMWTDAGLPGSLQGADCCRELAW